MKAQREAQELSQLVKDAKQSVAKHEPFVIKAMAFIGSFIKAKGDDELTNADNISLDAIRRDARNINEHYPQPDILIDRIKAHVEALAKTFEPTNKETQVPSMVNARKDDHDKSMGPPGAQE